ncbi:hypothetical protein [Pseudoxanthomonas mexicana]
MASPVEEYKWVMGHLEATYRDFEAGITPATPVHSNANGVVLRLPVQDVHHAIVLKLAALINFLTGALILCEAGVVLGQGALERMADEAGEDVIFLSLGVLNGMTARHVEFLDYFWREDFSDFDNIPGSFQSRPQVPREKINAAIHAIGPDPSTAGKTTKVLSKSYSGFVHAAAPHVMELYDAPTGKFVVTAAPDYRQAEHQGDLWNYVYRALTSMMFAAKAFGSQSHFDGLAGVLEEFQLRTNRDGGFRRKSADSGGST